MLRIAREKHVITVTYMNLREVLSEISGSWSISLLVGAVLAIMLQHLAEKLHPRVQIIFFWVAAGGRSPGNN